MRQSGRALRWIVNIMRENKIPFQVVGGLAARAYGANRKLYDIDIYVPDRYMDKVINETRKFIVFGPERVREKNWDLEFIKIMYAGQLIEIGSPEKTRIYDNVKKRWFMERVDFSKSRKMEVMGVRIPLMPKRQLISRKRKLGRNVDKTDLKQMLHPKGRRP
jgi:hypothetical protein